MRARSTAVYSWLWGGVAPALGVTVAVLHVPVLRHAQRTGTQAYFTSKVSVGVCGCGGGGGGWGGGLGVDSVRDGVLPDPLALSEVVDLPVIVPKLLLLLLSFKEVPQIQFIDLVVVQFLDKVGLWS